MTLYAIKSIFISTNKEKGINNYDTETLPFVYKSYTSAAEAIKGFVKSHIKENGYTAIDDYSCYFQSANFKYSQYYHITELIEMD